MARFLTEDELKGFEKYKYNSRDTSILSNYVMHPFWNWCVQFFPMWVAPNVMTFGGFLLTVVNFVMFSYYDFNFESINKETGEELIPRWVWAVAAINLFVAYTLDGIDGKQARRTGTSGPLGELFDHGLDSYSALLIPTCLYSIFGRDEINPLRFFFVLWNIFVNFYLTHWEKYNTGVMFLPWGYDFTMIGSCVLLGVTAWSGAGAWRGPLPLLGTTPATVFELLLYVSAIVTSHTVILWNIYRSYVEGWGKRRSAGEALRPLAPLLAWLCVTTAWAALSPARLLHTQPRLYYLLVGTVVSNINCRLIVSQMSDTRCAGWHPLVSLAAAAAAAAALLGLEPAALLLLLVIATAQHLRYAVGVVREMCQHFNIECFRIKPKAA